MPSLYRDLIDETTIASTAPDEAETGDGELRVRDLAKVTGVSVRNIRAYQDRGLLPAPRRTGRIVWYSRVHVERLGVIMSLLGRGFSLANIGELLGHWRDGSSVGDVVGIRQRITGPFTDEVADEGTAAEIIERYQFDPVDMGNLLELEEAGLIEVEGETWRIPSPRLFTAGVELHRVGVPIGELLAELRRIRANVQAIAEGMVDLLYRNLWAPHVADHHLPSLPKLVDIADVVDRIRPLATTVVNVELARALQASSDATVGRSLSRLVGSEGSATG